MYTYSQGFSHLKPFVYLENQSEKSKSSFDGSFFETVTHGSKALKDITDKYGFQWNYDGKLRKKQDIFSKRRQNIPRKIPTELDSSTFVHKQIDDKINRIYSKYKNNVPDGKIHKSLIEIDHENQPLSMQRKIEGIFMKRKMLSSNLNNSTAQFPMLKNLVNSEQKFHEFRNSRFSFGQTENPSWEINTGIFETEKKIVDLLCTQIEYDDEFRRFKVEFEKNDDPHKWGILADLLVKYQVIMRYHELVDCFGSSAEECNPFLSERNLSMEYEGLVHAYLKTEDHWKKKVIGQVKRQDLIQNLREEQLDVEGKGGIVVEDLVRFLNVRSHQFFRNRDLGGIFKRMAGKKKTLSYEQIIQVLSDGFD